MDKKLIIAVFMVLVIVGLTVAQEITITEASSPAAGKVSAQGGYKHDDKYSLEGITILVMPSGQKQGGSVNAAVDREGKKFSGTAAGLPKGKYDVRALLYLREITSGTNFYYYSNVKSVELK